MEGPTGGDDPRRETGPLHTGGALSEGSPEVVNAGDLPLKLRFRMDGSTLASGCPLDSVNPKQLFNEDRTTELVDEGTASAKKGLRTDALQPVIYHTLTLV